MDYLEIYNRLIEKAKSENRKRSKGIYYEGHHIIPRCMGGEGKSSDRFHTNIVLLTAKEHYIAHRLLVLIYPEHDKLRYALWNMINGLNVSKQRYIPSGRIYANIRELASSLRKNRTPWNKGKKLSEDEYQNRLAKFRATLESKGPKIVSEETRKKLSDAAKGKPAWSKGKKRPPRTEEHRRHLAEASRESWARRKASKSKTQSAPVADSDSDSASASATE